MNSDFWKRFPAIPGFDCLKMKHEIQSRIHEETKCMTQDQRLEYYRSGAKKLPRRGRIKAHHAEPLLVKEDPASCGPKPPSED